MIKPEDLMQPVIEGIDMKDYPDFSDAYLEKAYINQGGAFVELTQEELNLFNEEHAEWVHDYIFENQLYL